MSDFGLTVVRRFINEDIAKRMQFHKYWRRECVVINVCFVAQIIPLGVYTVLRILQRAPVEHSNLYFLVTKQTTVGDIKKKNQC